VSDRLAATAKILPRSPGVYLFKDARGRVIYVGKAKDLRARVGQYLRGTDGRAQVPFLVRAAVDVEITQTRTEKEALILENTLIKKHRPRYNVLQRDDTNFLHLAIDLSAEWPRYEVVRQIGKKRRHYGPYASAHRARRTLEYLSRRFPLRTCSDAELARRTRPCLLFEMHRCLGPCVDRCKPETYQTVVEESTLFLEGRNRELLTRLRKRMIAASADERYEDAAQVRDLILAIEASIEAQVVVDRKKKDRDCWALARSGDRAMAVLLPVRSGQMQEAQRFPVDGRTGSDAELLSTLLNTFYEQGMTIPPEILIEQLPLHGDALADLLSERSGRRVQLKVPSRGDKRRLLELAQRNAVGALQRSIDKVQAQAAAVDRLAEVARLPRRPLRIECYDNSNIQGTDPVASMVVFVDGAPLKSAYRRYRVKTVQGPDDYATMREILGRRVRRALKDEAKPQDALPDLIVVDGGKGQVGVVLAVLHDLGVHDVPVLGLAKPKVERARGDRFAVDKIIIPGAKDPKRLRDGDPALLLLQALRDESHRTAVRYHRSVRRKRQLRSVLDDIPGVGPGRKAALLKHLGSLKAVRAAEEWQIAQVPGIGPQLAGVIRQALED
jgi:excinuclease ABC subunit C